MKPHDNLATVSAAPRTVTIAGRQYPVGKLSPRIFGRMQALVMDMVPDPRDKVRKLMEGLPDAVQLGMWRDACEQARDWPPAMHTPEAQACLVSHEGFTLLLEMLVAPNVAGMTRADCEDLADRMDLDDFAQVMSLVQPGDPHAPKAAAADRPPGAS